MIILITGGNGLIGQKLARILLQSNHDLNFDELILVDIEKPVSPVEDERVRCLTLDLTQNDAIEELFNTNIDIIFHLAAILGFDAEKDMGWGHKVNVEMTRKLLEMIRQKERPETRLVFTSSLAVFGKPDLFSGEMNELSAHFPECSYGSQKSICELLINDYTRKGFVDGRVVRLPIVAVRGGEPNQAVTYFASGIISKPLSGQLYLCPVAMDTKIWVSSPETVAKNLIHSSRLPAEEFGAHRNVILPGITVTVEEMIKSLGEVIGEETTQLIRFELNEEINRIVKSLPVSFDIERALSLGFIRDNDFLQIIRNYILSQLRGQSGSSSPKTE